MAIPSQAFNNLLLKEGVETRW